jgi:hypothetical protein
MNISEAGTPSKKHRMDEGTSLRANSPAQSETSDDGSRSPDSHGAVPEGEYADADTESAPSIKRVVRACLEDRMRKLMACDVGGRPMTLSARELDGICKQMAEDLSLLPSSSTFHSDNGANGKILWKTEDMSGYVTSVRGAIAPRVEVRHRVITWVVVKEGRRKGQVWVLVCATGHLVYLGDTVQPGHPRYFGRRLELCSKAAALVGNVDVNALWEGLCGRLPRYKDAFVSKPDRYPKRPLEGVSLFVNTVKKHKSDLSWLPQGDEDAERARPTSSYEHTEGCV